MSPTPQLVAPAAVKPRPWVRVPRGLLADPRLVEVSGTARTLFCALYPEAVEDPTQGGPAGIGWLLTPAGAPATAGRLALLTKLSVEAVDNAIAELVAAGALTEGQSGAWGIVGWHREAPDTARVRALRARQKAAAETKGRKRQRRAAA